MHDPWLQLSFKLKGTCFIQLHAPFSALLSVLLFVIEPIGGIIFVSLLYNVYMYVVVSINFILGSIIFPFVFEYGNVLPSTL